MLLGALLDAGASSELLASVPGRLALEGVEIQTRRVERHGIGALAVAVVHDERRPRRAWRDIRALLDDADLPEPALEYACRAFTRIAEVEAAIHGTAVEDVHLHELGDDDALVDICGVALLLHSLAIEHVVSSPLPLARGLTRAAHGVLPLPAPATLELLRGAEVYGVEGSAELVTPTGAALVTTLADSFGVLPECRVVDVGYGAGTADFADRPNLVRVVVADEQPRALGRAEVVLVETNLDDLSPELVPYAAERCFEAGALDVWTVPATMKKGRPGVTLSALVRRDHELDVARAMLVETSAIGVRMARYDRIELEREQLLVRIEQGAVRVKVASLGGRVVNVAPEYEDCAALARASGEPLKAILAAATAAVRELR
jgi:pyridinium-3,5-bisthiocarboxylic acid mononucleotide nickel chelatase